MAATGYLGGDPTKVAKAGDTMSGTLVLDDASPAASEAFVEEQITGGAVTSVDGLSGDVVLSGSYAPLSTASDLATHEAATTDVHGLADTSALETQAGATAKVSTHASATDPHGDRAYAAAQASAAQTAAEAYADTGLAGKLAKASNLGDLPNPATARSNLGLGTAATTASTAYDPAGSAAAAQAASQPLNSDLTAIAGLTPADGDVIVRVSGGWMNRTMTQLKSALGLTKSDVGLGNVDNTSDVGKPVSTAQAAADALNLKIASNLSDLNDPSAARGNLGLGSAATQASSAFDAAGSAAAAQAASQPLDSDLTTIAGLTATTDNVIQSVAGSWASRTMAQLKTALALVKADVGLGNVDNTADASKAFAGSQITSGTVAYARLPVGTGASTVAAGDDSRLSDTRTPTDNSVTSAKIADGAIVNADINAAAAIALSKLATDPLARANHTGTQTASTVSDFDTQVRTSRLDQMAAPNADVSLASHKLTNVTDPGSAQDAATKNYVDSGAFSSYAAVSLGTNVTNGAQNMVARTEPGGMGRVYGEIVAGAAISSGTTLFTLPSGKRPLTTEYLPLLRIRGSGTTTMVTINTDGTVICSTTFTNASTDKILLNYQFRIS